MENPTTQENERERVGEEDGKRKGVRQTVVRLQLNVALCKILLSFQKSIGIKFHS